MRVTIQIDSSVFRVAGTAENVAGIGCFEERLLNALSLVRTFNRAGYTPVTLPINVRNNDWFIPRELDLWGAFVTVEATGETWAGQITGYEYDMAGVLLITATEKTAPELLEMVPDEVVHLFTVSETTHESAIDVTLPLVVGGTVADPILVKGILYDKVNGIYLLCVGEIRQVVKVYSGTEEMTEGFIAYTGTPAQALHPGFCFVQITDAAKRKNDDGSYAAISAEVVGLKLGTHTLEECRNGARFLLWFLKTAKSGTNAWGLGISESDIDLDSFTASIAKVDAAGLKMDGILYFRQQAMSWIDQICNAIRGRYRVSKNGKRNLFVDAPASSVKTYSPALSNIKLLQYGKGAYVGRVYNKGRLEHSYNPITGLFMQSDTYESATSIAKIDEQKFTGQSYLLRHPASAKSILDYTCKKSQTAAWKVQFETLELPDDAIDGQVITVDHPAHAIYGLYQIVRIQITDFAHIIEAEQFSVDDFVSGTPGTTIAWTKDAPISSAVNPGQASGLTLSSEVRPSPDGTNIVVLTGRFTPPTGGYLAASVEYAQGLLPILDWTDFGLLRGGSFEIAPVEAGQPYAVRIRMMSPTGKSSFITGTITAQGDDIPPGAPTITVSSYLKTVKIKCVLSPYPSDMSGFEVFRNTSNNSAGATSVGRIDGKTGVADFVDTETAYGMTYYYWAKAYDTWNNPSSFSAVGTTLITGINGADIVDGALARSELFASGVVNATAIAEEAVTASKTKLNAINKETGDLNANVVNTLQLNADAVTAEKVKSLSVLTRHLASGAVTTEKLLVGAPGSALNNDPGFLDATAWAYIIGGWPIITTVSDGVAGSGVARSQWGSQAWFNATHPTPLERTKQYRLRFWARRTADANGYLCGVAGLFDHAGGNIPGMGSQWFYSPVNVVPSTVWTEYAAIVNTDYHADARFIRPGVILNYGGTTGFMEVQDLRLEEVLPSTLIQDGAVTTPKIAAKAVVAGHVSAGAIETPALAAECVTSAKVDSTVVKTTELNVYGKNRCPDPAFDNVYLTLDYFDTGDQITVNGSRVSAWAAYKYGFPGLFAKVMHKQFWGGHLFGGSNGLALYSRYGSNYYSYIDSKPFPVTKNAKYHASLYAKELNGASAGFGRVVLILVWLKSDLSSCSPSQSYAVDHAISTASLTRYSGTATAPADAAFAIVRVFNSYPVSGSSSEDSRIAFSGIQVEEGQVATAWVNREQGTVTAERVVAGELKSLNYSTIAGSLFNLDEGTLILGGSYAPKLSWNGTTLSVKGEIHAETGNIADLELVSKTLTTTSIYNGYKELYTIYCDSNGNPGTLSVLEQTTPFRYAQAVTSQGKFQTHVYDGSGTTSIRIGGYGYNGTSVGLEAINISMLSSLYLAINTNGIIRGVIDHISDESIKSNINPVNTLQTLKSVDVLMWEYDDEKAQRIEYEKLVSQQLRESNTIPLISGFCVEKDIPAYKPSRKHIGVMAGAFNKAFGVNSCITESYSLGDGIGVALRAIQELAEIVDDQKAEIAELKAALNLPEKINNKKN